EQLDAKVLLDPRIADPLALAIKARRHSPETGLLDGDGRRWRLSEQRRRVGDDVLRRSGLVVRNVVDLVPPAAGWGPGPHRRDIADVDAIEHLPRLDDPTGAARPDRIDRAAARAVDPGEAKDHEPAAGPPRHILPGEFGCGPANAALRDRRDWRGLIDPGALL